MEYLPAYFSRKVILKNDWRSALPVYKRYLVSDTILCIYIQTPYAHCQKYPDGIRTIMWGVDVYYCL